MRSNQRLGAPIRPAQKRTVESAVMDCLNRGASSTMDIGDLVMTISSGKTAGWESHLARLYTEMLPCSVISFVEGHGVSRMQLVRTYEITKQQVGCRSLAFEQALSGQFVFTS